MDSKRLLPCMLTDPKPMSVLRRCAVAHLVAAAVFAFSGCGGMLDPPTPSSPVFPRKVEVVEVRSKPENESVQLIGRIEVRRR